MSNTILNWRFGSWHLQVIRFSDWGWTLRRGCSPITWRHNPYHDEARKIDPEWKWVEFHR